MTRAINTLVRVIARQSISKSWNAAVCEGYGWRALFEAISNACW
ncbi:MULTISPECIES: hypothetical protein [Nitrosomonas]|nr:MULTISPECIES: hypothetical protein [Nitrosomonas]UVS60219.1 hypothetical protein NX761_11910 [Nitrosomonas sp. PLL12]